MRKGEIWTCIKEGAPVVYESKSFTVKELMKELNSKDDYIEIGDKVKIDLINKTLPDETIWFSTLKNKESFMLDRKVFLEYFEKVY